MTPVSRILTWPVALLALQGAALWPHWAWMARRATDGSDEPWGVLALVTLAALVWLDREKLASPPPGVLVAAGGLSLAAALSHGLLPPLVAAAGALVALSVLLAGLLPPERPRAALTVLALLALPLAASLNFYFGYPLRWLGAEGTAVLLDLAGLAVTPEGAGLHWNGKTVLVDAPCAGIAMLWVGAFAATLVSYLAGAGTLRLAGNLFAAVGIVVAANVLRNALLFFKEAGLIELPGWSHEVLGLAVFALALLPIYSIAAWRPRHET